MLDLATNSDPLLASLKEAITRRLEKEFMDHIRPQARQLAESVVSELAPEIMSHNEYDKNRIVLQFTTKELPK